MESNNNGVVVDAKTATIICDSALIDQNGDAKHNDKNGEMEHIIDGDGGNDDDSTPNTIDSTLDAVKCIIENSNVLQHQTCVEATIPKVPPPPPIANTAPVVSNGCMSSWYSRCKWRSQSCDRKQKYCPRPRYSWINGHNNGNNSNNNNNNNAAT